MECFEKMRDCYTLCCMIAAMIWIQYDRNYRCKTRLLNKDWPNGMCWGIALCISLFENMCFDFFVRGAWEIYPKDACQKNAASARRIKKIIKNYEYSPGILTRAIKFLTTTAPLLTEIRRVEFAHFFIGVFRVYFTVGVQTGHRAKCLPLQ